MAIAHAVKTRLYECTKKALNIYGLPDLSPFQTTSLHESKPIIFSPIKLKNRAKEIAQSTVKAREKRERCRWVFSPMILIKSISANKELLKYYTCHDNPSNAHNKCKALSHWIESTKNSYQAIYVTKSIQHEYLSGRIISSFSSSAKSCNIHLSGD